ncbi:DNA-directed RNA polymerases I and III subunit RPAC1 [Trichomonascus vanleenenianus]|uniref:DNA-directed RNA polymerase core subunit RPC40 n=1 Tax=Trichomonascus vanleenenianus TaxID=2268995 RepID=UPI003ECB1B06
MTDRRNIVGIEHDRVTNTTSTDFPGHFPGEDNSWDLEKFKKQFDVKVYNLTDINANFDLIGCDTSIANAFRRIMIAEIPTVAFEQIHIYNNTSIIHDEVLAQRIGLVPIKIDPDLLAWYDASQATAEGGNPQEALNSSNCVMFSLNVKCEKNPDAPKDSTDPNELYINSNVYARDLTFQPFGQQSEYFEIQPSLPYPDILLAKLRPGQEISLNAFAVLGQGCDHAKFSPVATASYRLLPVIDITSEAPIKGELAEKFQQCFPPGVIELNSKGEAFVADARKDTVSREVLRHEEFNGLVKLGRKRDHFIFNIESTGAMQPDEIFVKAINQLKQKAQELLSYDLVG